MEENKDNISTIKKSTVKRNFKLKAILITVFLVFVAYAVSMALFHIVKAATLVRTTYNQAQELKQSINNQDWQQGYEAIENIETNLDRISYHMNNLGPISYLPKIGKDIKSVVDFVEVSKSLTVSYGETFKLFEDVSSTGVDLNLFSLLENRGALNEISHNKESLKEIEENIALAKDRYNDINVDDFSGLFSKKMLNAYYWLGEVIDATDIVIPVIGNLTDLLGYEAEKNYLLVFQNNMELRPTGGFIGSYGVITVKDGKLLNIFTDDVYNLDKLSEGKMFRLAPEQMNTYNKQTYWYMRDANWFSNYPDSAINILDFYNEERRYAGLEPQSIDGVIAITPNFISNVLDVVGPIESHGVSFSGENFAMDLEMFVEFDYEKFGIAPTDRKAIIGEISNKLIERMEQVASERPLDLWLAFKHNIDQKHILVYLLDEDLQKYFSDHNWAGEVMQTEGDYLMVVDSNFASLKTDAVMDRSINYTLRLNENDDLIARLEFTYKHTGSFVRHLITRYRTYAKVYAPEGTWFEKGWIRYEGQNTPINMSEDLEYGSEYGKNYAAYFVVIEPGDEKTVILDYKLPESIKNQYKNGSYSLLVQKQPGTIGHNMEIDLKFEQEISAYNSSNKPNSFKGKAITWQDILGEDKVYKLKF